MARRYHRRITLAIKGLAVASAIFGAISVVAGGLVVALGALVGALVVAYTNPKRLET